MVNRWIEEETKAIAEVRKRLHHELTSCPQFPEVVGDRRIMRFLRGKQLNIDQATKQMKEFLEWRKANNVDEIRQDIVYGGRNTPFKFPNAKEILQLQPQIVVTTNAHDKKGNPVVLDTFGFNPHEVMKAITKEEFIRFFIYTLEYRAIVMEQFSHEVEEKYLRDHPDPTTRKEGYGVMALFFCIRDLKGVGMSHVTTSDGRAILSAALNIGMNNYPEFLSKSHMTNVPWVFNSLWYFIKTFLDEATLAKINLCGGDYMDHLLPDITFDNIPAFLGGGLQLYNEPYEFDTSPTGPLYYPGCETDAIPFLEKKIYFEETDTNEYCYYFNGITPEHSIYATKLEESRVEEAVSPLEVPQIKPIHGVAPLHIELFVQEKTVDFSSSPFEEFEAVESPVSLGDDDSLETTVLNRNYLQLGLQTMSVYVKEFIQTCYRDNPLLSGILVILIFFTFQMHPNLLPIIGTAFLLRFLGNAFFFH